MVETLEDLRQQLAQVRVQLDVAETVLAQIRAHGDPQLAEKEARTRQLVEALRAQAEALHRQVNGAPARVLH